MNSPSTELFLQQCTPGVSSLRPYEGGKPVEELSRELGLSDIVKLASNENPLGPSPKAMDAIRNSIDSFARYPDGNGFYLKQALAQQLQMQPNQITLGNGSSDILEFVVRIIATPNAEVIYSQHGFAMYPIIAQACNVKPIKVPAINWGHDLDAMLAAVNENTRVVFIANPNNPTGTLLSAKAIRHFLEQLPASVICVVDEAYHEYVNADEYETALSFLNEFSNLVVTRTFSKAYGLAGLRVGYGVSHPQLADLMNRVRPPFNVNIFALAAAQAALDDHSHLQQSVKLNTAGMAAITDAASQMGLAWLPSQGNFVCIEFERDCSEIYQQLLQQGVIVRPIAGYEMPKHLRISIGTQAENDKFIQALKQVLSA
ncbi:MAG: histidinol-phosphate transaminase [Gammaproteobacteria bacterium]|nr:histidinol-phosphate transaminase [Gammaproteobacteria bacterium]